MMVVADQIQSSRLSSLTGWTCLYWWVFDAKDKKWKVSSQQQPDKCVPAYNFDFLFEKMRPVFLMQPGKDRLQAFDILLKAQNPADSLCKLAIGLAEQGLIK